MTRFALLLRGVNVGAKNGLPMVELAIPELADKSAWTPSPGAPELTPPNSPAPPAHTSPADVHQGLQRLDSITAKAKVEDPSAFSETSR
jgi:hypothetical protein